MTARDFCYWLQGYFEINHEAQAVSLNAQQLGCIRRHLNLVFAHDIDPHAGGPAKQQELNAIHHGQEGDPKHRPRC